MSGRGELVGIISGGFWCRFWCGIALVVGIDVFVRDGQAWEYTLRLPTG
jgi:hypothetical protein